MKRIPTIVALGVVAGVALLLPPPPDAPEPLAGVVIDRPGIESPIDASIWYCPWAQASADRDSFMAVASVTPADAEFTFPVAIPGEPADTASTATLGPGASGIVLSDIAQRGDSPALIEFSDGPAAAAVTVIGDVVTADQCVAQGPDEWFFVGGSTMTGETLTLRLFNPFPEVAKVTVTGFSEIGVEALGDLRSISVNPRSWRDIPFEELLRQRQTLVLSVRPEEGLVVPALSFGAGADEAWWVGTGLSASWELPVAQADGHRIGNRDRQPRAVRCRSDHRSLRRGRVLSVRFHLHYSSRSHRCGSDSLRSMPTCSQRGCRRHRRWRLGSLASGRQEPVSPPERLRPLRGWLLPGLRTQGLDVGTLWLLNTSDEPVSATVGVLTGSDVLNTRVTLEPGRVVLIPVEDEDALGYFVSAPEPFSAGWTVTGPSGIGFATGVAVPDE